MATKPYRALADELKAEWTPEVRAFAEHVGAMFDDELSAQARLGAEFAALRKHQHLSQNALAERATVQQADISRIERGLGNPTRETLTRIATALDARLTVRPREERAEV